MKEQKVSIKIRGTAPLIMHKFNGEQKQIANRSKKIYIPEDEAKEGLYIDKGGIYAPSSWIEGTLINSAKDFKKNKKSLAPYVKAGVLISQDKIRGNLNDKNYEIDARPVVVQRARIIRYRPLFRDWELEFDAIIIDTEYLDHHLLKELLDYAGKFKGIGDSRPKYGRFEVTGFEVV